MILRKVHLDIAIKVETMNDLEHKVSVPIQTAGGNMWCKLM